MFIPRIAVIFVGSSLVTLGHAQTVEIRVDDLISPQTHPQQADWISPLRDPGVESVALVGELTLRHGSTPRRWFEPDELASIVAEITKIDVENIDFVERAIVVAANDAAAVRESLLWIRQNLPPRIELEVALEQVGEDGTVVLQRTTETVRSGTTVEWTDVVTHRILRDFDVEIAQSAATANPVMDYIAVGSCLALRPRVVPGRDVVIIEAVARAAERVAAPPIQLHHAGFGDLDRGARDVDQCGITFVVPRGQSRVQEWTTHDGRQLRLTCRANWADAQPRPRRDVAILCSALLGRQVLGFRSVDQETDVDSVARELFRDESWAVADRRDVGGLVVATSSGTRAGKIVFVGDQQVALYDRFIELSGSSLAAPRVELDVFELGRGDSLERDSAAGRIARIVAYPLDGYWSVFSGQREMLTLRDWDVEVAQSARVPDPKISVIRDGYHFNLRVLVDGAGKVTGIALDGRIVRIGDIGTARVPLNLAMSAGGSASQSGGSITPPVVLPQDVVAVEKPEVRSIDLSSLLELDQDGRAVIRRAATRLLGPDRDLAIVVQVK